MLLVLVRLLLLLLMPDVVARNKELLPRCAAESVGKRRRMMGGDVDKGRHVRGGPVPSLGRRLWVRVCVVEWGSLLRQ